MDTKPKQATDYTSALLERLRQTPTPQPICNARRRVRLPPTPQGDALSVPAPSAPVVTALKPVAGVLSGRSRVLSSLIARSKSAARHEDTFKQCLPMTLRQHVQLIANDDGADEWIVLAENGAWATRVRYLLPTLRHQLARMLGQSVPRLRLRVRREAVGAPHRGPTAVRLQRPPDLRASRELAYAAERIHDPRLRKVMERLSRRLAGKSSTDDD